ncbi:MAG: hypothetical protein SVT52_03375 [Planctomycetota bacterium]|nr:hypothetical protein [Planctomycetota bacterium]
MSYAVVQTTLDVPPVESLRVAFQSLPQLTDNDAALMARDAFGILVSSLSLDDANTLQLVLKNHGVEAHVVDERNLPVLAARKRIMQADALAEQLILYDSLNRPTPTDWSRVALIAAGGVNLTEFKRVAKTRIRHRMVGIARCGMSVPVVETDIKHSEKNVSNLVLEIFLDGGASRYHILADKFRYTYLGEKAGNRSADNFVMLVCDLIRYAETAMVNRGAVAMTESPPRTFKYPTRHAFEEESIWLLFSSVKPAEE